MQQDTPAWTRVRLSLSLAIPHLVASSRIVAGKIADLPPPLVSGVTTDACASASKTVEDVVLAKHPNASNDHDVWHAHKDIGPELKTAVNKRVVARGEFICPLLHAAFEDGKLTQRDAKRHCSWSLRHSDGDVAKAKANLLSQCCLSVSHAAQARRCLPHTQPRHGE